MEAGPRFRLAVHPWIVSLACTQSPFLPTSTCDPNSLTTIQYVGSGSPNPDSSILPRDKNNFGPAIGFAWQVPWFGAGKTTVRGGYQVTFQRAQVQDQVLSGVPSANTLTQNAAASDGDILAITSGAVLARSTSTTSPPWFPGYLRTPRGFLLRSMREMLP